ncbi:MAG: TraG/TraD/VirD4 family protein [Actinomycetota bacterium]|nr:TraG/TraD/VirD4 family protein [Actinomycetota bacterium]
MFDEAANIAPLDDLDAVASTGAGQGIQLVTVWQDLTQMRARYGDRAHTILNNHRATMLLPGIKDPATLEHASRLVGEADVARASTTWDAQGQRSTTQGVEHRRLAPDHAMRTLPNGQAVVIYGSMAPLRVSLRPWYADPTLSARARRNGNPVAPAGVPSWAAPIPADDMAADGSLDDG